MDEDGWKLAKNLIALALPQSPGDRDTFLRDHCPDPALCAEIKSMLAQYDDAPDFLDADDSTTDLTPGDLIGPYEVVDRLGSGGMGQVFLATDTRLRRPVALKCLHTPEIFPGPAGAQILREARAAGRISHPNVATIYDIFEHDGRAFLVMEYLDGENLIGRLKRGTLPPEVVIHLGAQLAAGLAAAHAKGIIHRDVKPSNIQITPDGTPKILDFGVARVTIDASTAAHTLAGPGRQPGTPAYMSPEQLIGADVDARSDIFSLGVVLFEMATGRRSNPPFDPARPTTAATRPLPRADAIDAAVPRQLADIIAKMMAFDPRERFQSAAEVQSALAGLSGGHRLAWPSLAIRGRTWMTLLLVPIGIEALGFLISTSFNRTIGLTERFGWESPGDWFVWGLKSLLAPTLLVTIVMGAVAVAKAIGRGLAARSTRVARILRNVGDLVTRVVATLGLDDPTAAAQSVTVLGAISLVAVAWRYADLIHAFWNPISEMLPEQVASLASREGLDYRWTLTWLILALVFALRYASIVGGRRHADRSSWLVAGVVVLLAAITLHEMPYRIIYHSDFERADFNRQHCYVLGENRIELLIHCPAIDPPRNRIVKRGDDTLTRLGSIGSVYEQHP